VKEKELEMERNGEEGTDKKETVQLCTAGNKP
jgi:hypothetical protein